MPKLTRSDSPDGCTSHSRTARLAIGRSDATSRVTTAAPRISTASSSGGVSKTSERLVVLALIAGLIGGTTERTP